MPRKPQPEPVGQPEVTPEVGIGLLKNLTERARALLSARPLSGDAYSQWELLARNYLEKVFGRGSPNVNSVVDVGKYGAFPMDAGEQWWENHRSESLTTQVTRLEGLIELLETELQLRGGAPISRAASSATGHRIFIVHGHDEVVLQEVARFLERLDQEVVVLREQPNQGRTIIEKFEDYGDVGFAVVLLTADDRGGPAATAFDAQRFRARQNVILELGYFLGRLGRTRVCALYREGVEIPSDYSGVLYTRLDTDGAWRLQLARELKAAGLSVDMNKAL
jgi:predicted nucleotide-binding protein